MSDLPFKCSRCKQYFCSKHRLPENHDCLYLRKGNIFTKLARKRRKETRIITKYKQQEHTKLKKQEKRVRRKGFKFNGDIGGWVGKKDKQERSKEDTRKESVRAKKTTPWELSILIAPFYLLFVLIRAIFKSKTLKTLILIAALVGAILYAAFYDITEEVSETINKTKTVTSTVDVPKSISFSEFIENVYEYDKYEVTLKGFLKREVRGSEAAGVYVQSITDDDGNGIDLIGLTKEQIELFPKKGITNDLYEVEGVFKREYKTLKLTVNSIKEAKRDPAGKREVEEIVTYQEATKRNITRPMFPSLRAFVFNLLGKEFVCEDGTVLNECSDNIPYYCTYGGLTKKPIKCGCPQGERFYSKECIPKVECSDGTLEPDCSENKPKICVNGKLIDNAEICGCPDGDYKQDGKKCIRIERCSDGTIYRECSKDKPFYCISGSLVKMASKCGCESSYYPNNDDCVEMAQMVEINILKYTNIERKSNGVAELRLNDQLCNIARVHSQDMAKNNYFSHTNLRGEEPSDRANRMGFSQQKELEGGWYTDGIAENIGTMGTGNIVSHGYVANDPDSIARAQVNSWMGSSGHRMNILNEQYSDLGVGVAYDGSDYISTQNFW